MQAKEPERELVKQQKSEEQHLLSNFVRSLSGSSAHVVALIPRGEVIRNFVHTRCLNFVASAVKLSVLTVSPGFEIDNLLRENYENVFQLEDFDEHWLVRFQREILDLAHNRWLWSKAAQERWRLRNAEAKTVRQKSVRAIKKVASLPFASRRGLQVLSKVERFSSRRLKTTDAYIKLYQQIKPTLIFNGSHIHSKIATQAVQAADWLGIPTATFIFSWDNLTSQGRIMLPYDYFFVWNETLRRQLLEMYEWVLPEQVFVTGTPQFDFHFRNEFYWSREEFCASVGADPARPIVLYTTGMANHMPGEPEIVEHIANILQDFNELNSPQLLVRVYPKDLTGRFDALKQRRQDILFPPAAWEAAWLTPKHEDSYTLVNTLRHAALGINVASTVSLELCMFDKPVINVGYNPESVSKNVVSYRDYYDFDHYRPVVESGAVQVAWQRDQMKRLIHQALINPNERKNERRALIKRMFGATLDGQSGSRVAQALIELASGEKHAKQFK